MARRSNKAIKEILSASKEYISFDDSEKELDRKITLATECFPPTQKWSELTLRDRIKLSKQNGLTACNYIIDYRLEVNASPNTIRIVIQHLTRLSQVVGIEKIFEDMMAERDDIISFLDKYSKSQNDDPMHKWYNTYNTGRDVVIRFLKWLRWKDVSDDPKSRDKLSFNHKEPRCIQDIPRRTRKEKSSYKGADMWDAEDDLLFLKFVPNKRDICYHMMSRDLSARPHEILHLKIRDVKFQVDPDTKRQYALVPLNGKTGSRDVPLTLSVRYLKDWLDEHPSRNNENSPLFVTMNNNYHNSNHSRQLTREGLYTIYRNYKKVFFPELLQDPTISNEDKEKIKALLGKPWNPYVRRHTGLTEKAGMLKEFELRQYVGWSLNSDMPRVYINFRGNESTKSLLKVYEVSPKNGNSNSSVNLLSPKICSNCNEENTIHAKFCANPKCRMVLSIDAYFETLQQQKEKEVEMQRLREKYEQDMTLLKQQVEQNKIAQEEAAAKTEAMLVRLDKKLATVDNINDITKREEEQMKIMQETLMEEDYRRAIVLDDYMLSPTKVKFDEWYKDMSEPIIKDSVAKANEGLTQVKGFIDDIDDKQEEIEDDIRDNTLLKNERIQTIDEALEKIMNGPVKLMVIHFATTD